MKKALGLLTLSAGFAVAADWTGSLVDAACYDRQNQPKDVQKAVDSCAATSQSSAFAIYASGKVFKLDATGNSKAMSAMKNRADRSEPGKAPTTYPVTAKVSGTETGGTIKVDSIDVQ